MKAVHVAMTVRNTQRTLDFYCNILGGKLLWEAGEPQTGTQTDTIFGLNNVEVLVSGIELHGIIIEFFEFLKPKVAEESFPGDYRTGGWKHLALAVDDIETEVERLKAQGVQFRFPVQRLPGGIKMAYFNDPDGIILELIEQKPV